MGIIWLAVPFVLIYLVYRWNKRQLQQPREHWESFWEVRRRAHETREPRE